MRCIFQSAKLRTNTHTHSQVGIHRHSHTHTDRHTQSGWQAVFINYKLRADYTHYKCYFRATAASPSSAYPSLSLSIPPFAPQPAAQLSGLASCLIDCPLGGSPVHAYLILFTSPLYVYCYLSMSVPLYPCLSILLSRNSSVCQL